MSGVKNLKVKIPKVSLHHSESCLIVELGTPFSDVIRCRLFAVDGGRPIGWTMVEANQRNHLFWPCSSPFNFARALAFRAVRRRPMPHWKVEFVASLLAARLLKLIRPTVAQMDPAGVLACSQISKHIRMLDWRSRCYDDGTGLAVAAHIDHGVPLRPALALSSTMSVMDGRPLWRLAPRCAEDHPKDALEYQYGDVGLLIYEALLQSKRQLRAVDITSRMINGWSFGALPKKQQDIELLAFAFVHGMHACQCCIGGDVEVFTAKIADMMKKAPRKGRRAMMYHADVCINDCKARNCQKVEDEPIL